MAGQATLGEMVLNDAKAGNAEAPAETVESLVCRHTLLVFRIAYSILRNHHDAEDAAQECFLRAWKWRHRLKQVRHPKTWLARIAWTAALDRRSRRARFAGGKDVASEEALEALPDGGLLPDEKLAGRQMRDLLEKMVLALPEELRQPLELSTVQELNSAEIAEIMAIPESSVRTRLMRARRLLKEKLAARLEVRKYV